jgi:hypothetical protein
MMASFVTYPWSRFAVCSHHPRVMKLAQTKQMTNDQVS